ncbi:MAG: DUF3859 domain-containing protein [Reyranella sp.]|nr:DUF3859 domain-containing protein [Reyranella sp.]
MAGPLGIAILALTVLMAVARPSLGQAVRVDRIELLEAGLYRAEQAGRMPAPGSVAGNINRLASVTFYEQTSRVPARVGVRFGVRFDVIGAPERAIVPLRAIWRFPAPGLRDPRSGKVYTESVENFRSPIGEPRQRGYGLDNDWELVPGEWTFEILYVERRLLSHTFTVYKP